MEGEAPLGRRRLDFGTLAPDEFEMLCYLVVLIDYPDALRFAAPDSGADSGLPAGAARFTRCWQAKRFTGHIGWSECERSLDSAVASYAMLRYTFCFARDLTRPQDSTFRTRLGGRHESVEVDYWSHSRIEAKLLESEQGQRIANAFYGDPEFNARAIMRAIRAGGALETGADVLARLDEIAEHLAARDPHYFYITVTREVDVPGPPPAPSTIIAVETRNERIVERIEAVPRNPNSIRPPEGTLFFEDTPEGRDHKAKLERFFRAGGDLMLEGVRFELRNLPPLFEDMHGEQSGTGTVVLRSPRRAVPPWHPRFIADTDRGRAHVDVLLQQGDPPEGWSTALRGHYGGMDVVAMFREFERAGGEMRIHWSYTYTIEMGVRAQAEVLAFIDAAHGIGLLAVEDRQGSRPTVREELSGRDLDPEMTGLKGFLEGLVTIADWTGHSFTLPEHVPREEVQAVLEAAQTIRTGSARMNVDEIELFMPLDEYERAFAGPGQVAAAVGFGVVVLGDEVLIGELGGVVPDTAVETERVSQHGEEYLRVRLRPTTEQGRHPVFALTKVREAPR